MSWVEGRPSPWSAVGSGGEQTPCRADQRKGALNPPSADLGAHAQGQRAAPTVMLRPPDAVPGSSCPAGGTPPLPAPGTRWGDRSVRLGAPRAPKDRVLTSLCGPRKLLGVRSPAAVRGPLP